LAVRTNQLDYDDEVTFAAEREIYDCVRGRDARPLLLVASLTHPHDPYAITRDYFDLYRDEDIDMPGPPIPPERLDPHSQRVRKVCAMDEVNLTDAQIRTARRAYYGEISYVDSNVGRLMKALRECGLAEKTIVVVVADHGEMLGDKGLWYKMSFFENSARVPLIVHAPARFAPRRVAAAASLLDVTPTLVELAGGCAEDVETDGRSLKPHLEGGTAPDETFAEYLAEGAVAPIVMIRRGPHKFIASPADPDQLYDLTRDPGERTNLAADPALFPTVAAFRAEAARRWRLDEIDRDVRANAAAASSPRRWRPASRRHGISSPSATPRNPTCATRSRSTISKPWPATPASRLRARSGALQKEAVQTSPPARTATSARAISAAPLCSGLKKRATASSSSIELRRNMQLMLPTARPLTRIGRPTAEAAPL
jgi:choline-sulfatase